jgi:hypothetical protein
MFRGLFKVTVAVVVALLLIGSGSAQQNTVNNLLLFQNSGPQPYIPGFNLGINLSGMEDEYPIITSPAEINYYTTRGFTKFRLPFGWSRGNPTYGTVGIQPLAYGPLDTTSTYLPFIPSVNYLENSELVASTPWSKYNASGTFTITNNSGIGPNGTSSATLIQANRTDTSSYFVIVQPFNISTSGNYTESIWVKAADPASVGKIMSINYYTTSGFAQVTTTLTNTWQLMQTTANLTGTTQFQILPYAGSSISGEANFYVAQAQVNAGSSVVAYQPTTAGYLQVYDAILSNIAAAGATALIDAHTFGGAPGGFVMGSPESPCSVFADMWQKVSAHYKGNPAVRAYDLMNEPVNGFNVNNVMTCYQAAINAIRSNGDTTPIYTEGVNYAGVWNWVSGQGNPYNNSNLYQLTDPLNRLVMSAHGYLDNDSSGTNFSWAQEIAKPGVSPPGTPTSSMIGPERETPFVNWARLHGVQIHHGETGGSNDALSAGGNDNYAAWNTALSNIISFAKTNNYEIDIWGAGGGFNPDYPAFLGPSSVSNSGATDFSSAGLQSTMMVMLEQYTGYSGPQPTAYRVDLPVTITQNGNPEGPNVTPVQYQTTGVASGNFTVRYNGLIPSGGCIVTPHDYLPDGVTSAGGTFTSSSVTLAAGQNGIGYFTYTASQVATIIIKTTNNCGWTDPPQIAISTQADAWHTTSLLPTPLYNLYRSYTPYVGPAIQLRSPATGVVQNWSFTSGNNLDRVAIQAWAGQQSGIPVLSRYDQSPLGSNLVYGGTLPTLTLQNAQGYPEINYTAANGNMNVPLSRHSAMTILTRMNSAGTSSDYLGMAFYTGPFEFTSIFTLKNPSWIGGTAINSNGTAQGIGSVNLGVVNNVYHEYALTYQAGIASGLTSYVDGTLFSNAATANSATEQFTLTQSGTISAISNLAGVITLGDAISGPLCTGVPAGTVFVSQNTDGTYNTNNSWTASNVECNGVGHWYLMYTAFDSQTVTFGYNTYGGGAWVGKDQALAFLIGTAATSGQLSTIDSYETTHYSTALPDVLPPIFTAVTNQSTVSGTASTPFGSIVLQDVAGTSNSIVFTLTGQAATLSGTGLTGSNPYTLTSDTVANINTKLKALQFTATGSVGAVTNIAMVTTSSTGLTAVANPTVTITSASHPIISGLAAPSVSLDQGAPPLWKVSITDANPSPTVSASIVVTGSGGTLTHIGPTAPSGSGPYTFAADTPANLTRWLCNLLWTPSVHTAGTTTTFTLTVTNALGLSTSASNTITNVAPQAMPTPITPINTPATLINPSGTNRGMAFSGTESSVPQIYEGTYAWAATQLFGTIRWPFLFSNMVITSGVVHLYANFNSTELGYSTQAIEWARKYGQWLKFDDHAYGGIINPFNTGTTDDATFITWGADVRSPASGFADLWQRMATYYSLYPNIMIGLQNESMYDTNTNTLWRANATAATAAIRTVLPSVLIELPSAANVGQFITAVWTGYTDTGPFHFGIHQYFDNDGGQLNTCVPIGVTGYFSGFTTWARANGYKASVSEFAWGTDSSCMSTLGPSIVAYFNTNSDIYSDWQWWAGGQFSPSYQFYMGPETSGSPAPQYSVLAPYLP